MAKQKINPVCINILPSFTKLELVQYDPAAGAFLALDSDEFMFDLATREMVYDQESFRMVIKRLYERNKIPLRTPTTIVVPSFFTRQYAPPEGVDDMEEIEAVLMSEVERFYVFKKVDPKIGFCTIKDNQILYTAYPLVPLQMLEDSFVQLKIPITSIDCNYTAILRGLVAMGLVEQEVTQQIKWAMVVVSDFSLFLAIVEGMTIEKIMESPLSVQNAEEDVLLNEIGDDFKQFCGYEVLNKVVIINNSEKMYSTRLLEVLDFKGPSDVFDQNSGTLSSLGREESPFPCSLEAIGGTLLKYVPQVSPLNLASPQSAYIGVDEQQQNIIAGVIAGIGLLIFLAQFGMTTLLDMLINQENTATQAMETETSQQLSSQTIVPQVKQKLFVQKALEQNYKISNMMVKLAQSLPPDAWLNSVKVTSSIDLKALTLEIKGGALSSDPLNAFVNDVNSLLPEGQKLTPSIAPQQKDDNRFFDFTLTNPKPAAGP